MKINKRKILSVIVLTFIALFLVSAKYDAMTDAQLAISYPHHELHEGNFYSISRSLALPVANDEEIYFKAANTKKWPHIVWSVVSDAAVTVSVYETTLLVHVGANAITPVNRNRNSTNTSGMTWSHTPSGVGSDGSLIWTDTAGVVGTPVTASPGSLSDRSEFILKQNTAYLMRIAGASGDVVTLNTTWYEHTTIR